MTIPKPTLSVVLPTYNRAALLPRAIQTVLDQSYRDLELIVVDDGSTDDTQEVLSRISDHRLRVVRQPSNGGPCLARNAGIRAAHGRYIGFQDSDSAWLPGKIEKQIALLEHPQGLSTTAGVCYSRFALVCGDQQVIHPSDPADALSGHIYSRLLRGNTMDTPAMIIPKEVLDHVGCFDETMPNLEDWDLALRISLTYPVIFLDEVTILSYLSRGGVNARLAPESKLTILRKNYEAFQRSPEAMAALTWSIGEDYAMRGDRRHAVEFMKLSTGASASGSRGLLIRLINAGLNPFPMLHSARRLWRATRLFAAGQTRQPMLSPAQQNS